MVPAEALTQVFAGFHAGIPGPRKLFQQRRAEHAGAAPRIEDPAYRQADVVGMRGDEPGPVTGFEAGGDGRAGIEIETLVIGTVERRHESSSPKVARNTGRDTTAKRSFVA